MKKTDLEKNKALKLLGELDRKGIPSRFSTGSASDQIDRREQRKLDQAQGLVSFPVKIKETLVQEIRARAVSQNISTNAVINALLEQALKA